MLIKPKNVLRSNFELLIKLISSYNSGKNESLINYSDVNELISINYLLGANFK